MRILGGHKYLIYSILPPPFIRQDEHQIDGRIYIRVIALSRWNWRIRDKSRERKADDEAIAPNYGFERFQEEMPMEDYGYVSYWEL